NITFARELLRRFQEAAPDEDVVLLADRFEDEDGKVAFAAGLLAMRNIPARLVHGLQLVDAGQVRVEGAGVLRPWLAVQQGGAGEGGGAETPWTIVDPRTDAAGWPDGFFLWSASGKPVALVDGN